MDIKKLTVVTAIISTLLLLASFVAGFALYHEIKAQIITETNKELKP